MDEQSNHQAPENRWQIDRHIPVALIFTMLGQLVGVVWWGSSMQHALTDHERRLSAQETGKVSERMAVVETQIRSSQELQIEMNRKLDKIIDRQTGVSK